MKFRNWLEAAQMGLQQQQPTTGNYLATAAKGIGKAVAGAIPFAGTVVDVGSTVKQMWEMKQRGQDVTQLVLQMMHQQDKAGMPANAFDLDDNLAAMLSNPSKMAIAKGIVIKIDNLYAQMQNQQIDSSFANKEAVAYIQNAIQGVS